jgi:signal transduction histidine kinase
LLGGYSGTVTRLVGDRVELAAVTSTDTADDAAFRTAFLQSRHYEGAATQAILARTPINVADALTDARFPDSARARAQARGFRSAVFVPLLRREEAIGAISVSRREPGGFTGDEIALLQMFAGQAVIAIENARLLSELQERTEDLTRSVGELRALSEIGQAIGSTLDLQTVLTTIVARATTLAGADAGVIYEYDPHREVFEPRAAEHLENEVMQALVATPVRKGQGATGRLAEVREPIQRVDLRVLAEQAPVRDALIRAGYRALLAVPLVRENDLIGGLTVFRKTPGEYAANVVELMQTFATQSALAIQNARLFLEIEDKSRQLEAASQHKSEFLANMSHELRTPLNAIIGFSEVLTERMFGELNEKQDEYLKDIYASGQHLLSLINDILDLSKIEAGRMELEVADFHLPLAIENAVVLVRERALRRGLTLEQSIDPRLGEMQGDERKIKQVLLNLLSNAIKFTPEGGRVGVRAAPMDEHVEVAVSDTGVGIAPEDLEAVFEEFRQVGAAEKRAEGTGLGLALARKFIELHGGRIWVKSQIGAGSTFTFTLPVRHGD